MRKQTITAGLDEVSRAESRLSSVSRQAAVPLPHALAVGDDEPMPFDVVKNAEGKYVIHIFRRPDVSQELGEAVVQYALNDVFGRPPEGVELLYRDEEEIMKKEGLPRKVLPTDSWYIELPVISSMLIPSPDYLRDKLRGFIRSHFSILKGGSGDPG